MNPSEIPPGFAPAAPSTLAPGPRAGAAPGITPAGSPPVFTPAIQPVSTGIELAGDYLQALNPVGGDLGKAIAKDRQLHSQTVRNPLATAAELSYPSLEPEHWPNTTHVLKTLLKDGWKPEQIHELARREQLTGGDPGQYFSKAPPLAKGIIEGVSSGIGPSLDLGLIGGAAKLAGKAARTPAGQAVGAAVGKVTEPVGKAVGNAARSVYHKLPTGVRHDIEEAQSTHGGTAPFAALRHEANKVGVDPNLAEQHGRSIVAAPSKGTHIAQTVTKKIFDGLTLPERVEASRLSENFGGKIVNRPNPALLDANGDIDAKLWFRAKQIRNVYNGLTDRVLNAGLMKRPGEKGDVPTIHDPATFSHRQGSDYDYSTMSSEEKAAWETSGGRTPQQNPLSSMRVSSAKKTYANHTEAAPHLKADYDPAVNLERYVAKTETKLLQHKAVGELKDLGLFRDIDIVDPTTGTVLGRGAAGAAAASKVGKGRAETGAHTDALDTLNEVRRQRGEPPLSQMAIDHMQHAEANRGKTFRAVRAAVKTQRMTGATARRAGTAATETGVRAGQEILAQLKTKTDALAKFEAQVERFREQAHTGDMAARGRALAKAVEHTDKLRLEIEGMRDDAERAASSVLGLRVPEREGFEHTEAGTAASRQAGGPRVPIMHTDVGAPGMTPLHTSPEFQIKSFMTRVMGDRGEGRPKNLRITPIAGEGRYLVQTGEQYGATGSHAWPVHVIDRGVARIDSAGQLADFVPHEMRATAGTVTRRDSGRIGSSMYAPIVGRLSMVREQAEGMPAGAGRAKLLRALDNLGERVIRSVPQAGREAELHGRRIMAALQRAMSAVNVAGKNSAGDAIVKDLQAMMAQHEAAILHESGTTYKRRNIIMDPARKAAIIAAGQDKKAADAAIQLLKQYDALNDARADVQTYRKAFVEALEGRQKHETAEILRHSEEEAGRQHGVRFAAKEYSAAPQVPGLEFAAARPGVIRFFQQQGATHEQATAMSSFIEATNNLTRAAIITNPLIHPLWNLAFSFIASKGEMAFLGITPNLKRSLWWKPQDWKAEHSPGIGHVMTGQAWEDFADQNNAIMRFAQSHGLVGGNTVGPKIFSLAGFAERGFGKTLDAVTAHAWNANQGIVFDYLEHNFSVELFRHHFEENMRDGMTVEAAGAKAGLQVRKAFGDYLGVSKTGIDKAMNQAFFFYPWLRSVTPFAIKTIVRNPGVITGPYVGMQKYNEESGDPDPKPNRVFTGLDANGQPTYWYFPGMTKNAASIFEALAPGGRPEEAGVGSALHYISHTMQTHARPSGWGGIIHQAFDVGATLAGPAGEPNSFGRIWNKDADPATIARQVGAYELNVPGAQQVTGLVQGIGDLAHGDPRKFVSNVLGGFQVEGQPTPVVKRGQARLIRQLEKQMALAKKEAKHDPEAAEHRRQHARDEYNRREAKLMQHADPSGIPPGFARASIPPGFAPANASGIPPGFARADSIPPGFARAAR